jgi:uncharacterized protein (TIGR00369 family)
MNCRGDEPRHCEERSDEAIQLSARSLWIASRSLSSGAHSRDPLARNDGGRSSRPKANIAFKTLYAVHSAARSRSLERMTADNTDIPEGFERQSRRSPLTDPWEPIYSRQTPDAIILGLRLATPHTNARGFVHGGLIAALTDKAMGHSCGHKMRGAYSLVTVSMSIDFISSAQIGQWLTVETDVIKTGSTLCFAQCFVKADDAVIARANATFRVGPKKD